jgi:hydroxypyruvate isomerase
MPRFAANLSLLYTEVPFLERFAMAAADGFEGVEYLFPYEYSPEVLARCLEDHQLEQALFNAPPGDWAAGERGVAALPGRTNEFRNGVLQALAYAAALECPRIHVLAGIPADDMDLQHCQDVYLDNLAWAAGEAAAQQVDILIEPINQQDMPGYFLSLQDEALSVCQTLNLPNLKVQFDTYHCQMSEGNVTKRLQTSLPHIGHIQIAGVPGRHEPDIGELNYPFLFAAIDAMGYLGWVGCEYRPRSETRAGLGWLRQEEERVRRKPTN